MARIFEAVSVPLSMDTTGTVRVHGTRLTLDTVLGAYERGDTPQEIVEGFPDLSLADVHAISPTICEIAKRSMRTLRRERHRQPRSAKWLKRVKGVRKVSASGSWPAALSVRPHRGPSSDHRTIPPKRSHGVEPAARCLESSASSGQISVSRDSRSPVKLAVTRSGRTRRCLARARCSQEATEPTPSRIRRRRFAAYSLHFARPYEGGNHDRATALLDAGPVVG
jgi:hypothetical protein